MNKRGLQILSVALLEKIEISQALRDRPPLPQQRQFVTSCCSLTSDRTLLQVSVYVSTGSFKRRIGKTGPGTGEFLALTHVVVLDSLLAVYDEQLGRESGTRGKYPR